MAEVFEFNRAILRRPGASVVKGLRAGGGPDPVLEDVLTEHAGYERALAEAGLTLTVLDPLEEFPDAIFVEDPALVFSEGAIVLKPGAPSREAEGEYLRPTLNALFDRVLELPHGHADGGDVLVLPDKVLIGLSARTLEKMRGAGQGPRFRKHGRYVRYHIVDLDAWSESGGGGARSHA